MTVAVSKPAPFTAQGAPLLSARKQLDVITAYREVGTYRGAAQMCGLTHKTVKRVIEREFAVARRVERRRNYESVRSLVAAKVEDTKARISAKRLLPAARAAGYGGSDRNFRRLVAQEKSTHRQRQAVGGLAVRRCGHRGKHLPTNCGSRGIDGFEIGVGLQVGSKSGRCQCTRRRLEGGTIGVSPAEIRRRRGRGVKFRTSGSAGASCRFDLG